MSNRILGTKKGWFSFDSLDNANNSAISSFFFLQQLWGENRRQNEGDIERESEYEWGRRREKDGTEKRVVLTS